MFLPPFQAYNVPLNAELLLTKLVFGLGLTRLHVLSVDVQAVRYLGDEHCLVLGHPLFFLGHVYHLLNGLLLVIGPDLTGRPRGQERDQ